MATAQQPLNSEVVHDIPLKPPQDAALVAAIPTPLDLLRQAIAQGVSVDQLERLQAMCERWEANQARKAYRVAMNAFKAEAPTILKNAHVKIDPKDSSKRGAEYDHATLDHVCDQVIPLLAKHDLSHDWKTEQKGEWITVTCILTHECGHSEERSLMGCPDNTGSKNSIQAIASTVTYLERYTLLMVCGLAAKGIDNDGRGVTIEAGILDQRVEELCGEISRASNIDQLRKIYTFAYREAERARNVSAMSAYIRSKDARKRELA